MGQSVARRLTSSEALTNKQPAARGDEDGDLAVFALSAQKKLLAENTLGSSVYSTPVVADDTLYISTREHLIAIKAEAE